MQQHYNYLIVPATTFTWYQLVGESDFFTNCQKHFQYIFSIAVSALLWWTIVFSFFILFFFLANFLILYYFNRKWFEIVEITYPANIDDWYAYTAVLPLIQKAHRNVCQLRKLRTGSPSIDILFRKSQKKK